MHRPRQNAVRMMFTCGNGSEVSNDGEDVFGGETVDKILSEVAKLKRKCKSLRTLLLETETKRQEEKETYDATLERISSDCESKLAALKTQFYIEIHQAKESRTIEINELSSSYHAAQREVSMQGALIMSLQERLQQVSQQFRLPSEVAAVEEDKRRKANKTINALMASIEDLTERLDQSERSRAALDDELQRCREENAQLRDQLHSSQLQLNQGRLSASSSGASVNSPKVGGGGSPALGRGLGRKPVPFGPLHLPDHLQSDSDQASRASAEDARLLQAAQTEIAELKGRIGELVRTKEAVEQSVRSVLGDNEALSRALDQLSRRTAPAFPPPPPGSK